MSVEVGDVDGIYVNQDQLTETPTSTVWTARRGRRGKMLTHVNDVNGFEARHGQILEDRISKMILANL